MHSVMADYIRGIAGGFNLIRRSAPGCTDRICECRRPGRHLTLLLAGLIWVLAAPGLTILSGLSSIGPGLTSLSGSKSISGLTTVSGLFTSQDAQAQRNPAFYDYPYHHLDWYTIESDHFFVHFQEGNSRPAQVISRIAEEIYEPITDLYGHDPDHKVSIVLIDRLDYSNGAAFFYDNKIEIWLPSLDTPLRGTHNWLRNVITHEFAHIVQLQSSMKRSRRRPATYLQWLSYEDVRRPDVLYGFPNGIISYPFFGISMPAWMAEGTAQYMRDELNYDDWDSHRDMLLRTRILDGTHLSLEKMGTFSSKTSLERELTYNQGFAFTRYIADRFGEQSIADITRSFSRRGVYDVRKAIKLATGVDGAEVYNDWISELQEHYAKLSEGRIKDPENRTWIESDGFFNFHPAFDPDGKKIAYLSNKRTDGAMVSLFVRDFAGDYNGDGDTDSSDEGNDGEGDGNVEGRGYDRGGDMYEIFETLLHEVPSQSHSSSLRSTGSSTSRYRGISPQSQLHEYPLNGQLMRRLETSFSYSPDGKKIAYSRTRLNAYGEQYRDLYLYDTDDENRERLTFSERLQDPAWSPDGSVIAAGKIEDGSVNLFFYHIEQDSLYRITDFQRGEQIYRPVWHPDGNTLYFAYADIAQRGIYKISLADLPEEPNTSNTSDKLHSSGKQNSLFTLPQGDIDIRMTPVLTDAKTDNRDPVISADSRWLYFSADPDGVFNIYRKSLDSRQIQQVTNVVGGAFMPFPHPEKDQLLYSEFTSEGYKIALLDLSGMDLTYLPARENPAGGAFSKLWMVSQDANYSQDGNYSQIANYSQAEKYSQGETGSLHESDPRFGAESHNEAPMNIVMNRSDLGDEPGKASFIRTLNRFDDSDISPLSREATAVADTGVYHYQLPTRGSSPDRQFYQYNDQFTTFQFYPVFRFDNYSRIRGSNTTLLTDGHMEDLGANLWRDFKLGTYFSSREMRERFSIFGGALFGPGSRPSNGASNFFSPARLVNLDRDLFFEVQYSGLPFIKRHWSPTISLEFFNIRRNVQDGLQIEEFPCTSCLPDTTSINIAYNMWEAQVNLISKVNRWSLVELGYYYSPYRVSTESFFSREFQQEVSGSTSRYYIGSTWNAAWSFDLSLPDRHSDIAPIGWRGLIRYRYEPSELLDSYDVRDGTLIPIYNEFDNHSFEFDLRMGFDLWDQRFNIRSRFFSYLDGPDEFFYLDYIGGMIGMRSYPYFALGGTTTAYSQLSWFIPLKTDIYRQMGRVTLDKIFLRLFTEAGNGWGGPLDIDNSIKTGVGAELRVGMNSYYLFPTSFFISGAYGFDSYDIQLPDAFITETATGRVGYGNQVLINFGILFDFEF